MKINKIKSNAKLNLALNITGKKKVLHKIESIIGFIDLHDVISINQHNGKKHHISFYGKFSKNIGKKNSPLMLIGEAPGAEEEKLGVPFRGEVGELLNKMLIAINIKRQNIYTSYAINFRPPDDRKPTSIEIKRYSVFLKEHISIINPKIIVLMGSSAMEALTGISEKITNERGHWKEVILKNKTFPLMITFNPSYLIRFPENKKHSWEDLKKIRDKIKDLNLKF